MAHSEQTSERTVSELGESGILQVILPIFPNGNAILGPGDDAGAVGVTSGEILVSVDTLVQDQDFRLKWPSGIEHQAFDIGWKSAAQNLSDINAMGGRTTAVLISLSIPAQTSVAWVEDFAQGFAQALKELSTSSPTLLGGDLGVSKEISVTTTVLGECATEKVLRSGAQPGDIIAVAGRVGVAAAGLALLESNTPGRSWGRALRRLVQGQNRPVPPLESGPRAAEAGARSMMDLSDGLIIDGTRLAKSSGVDLHLDSAALAGFAERLQPAAELLKTEPLQWVLYGGEDFSLLATFPDEKSVPEEFVIIGKANKTRSKTPAIYIDGEKMAESKGFDHFS